MRKFQILCAMLLITATAFAQQPKKGSILVGGGISMGVAKNTYENASSGFGTETNYVNFNFSPRGGFTLFPGFMVGGIINLGAGTAKSGTNKTNSSSISIGPFVRYYLPMGLFGEVNFTGGIRNSKFISNGTSSPVQKDGVLSSFAGAGFAYFLTPSVSLEPLIGFGYDRVKYDNDDVSKNSGLRFQISLVVYLKNE